MASLTQRYISWLLSLLVAGVGGWSGPALAQSSSTRSVKGLVIDQAERPLRKAVVQLKNTKTLQVKSFIVNENGAYYFHGLDLSVDYELRAQYEGASSRAYRVSSFDDRREVTYNIVLEIPAHKEDKSLSEDGSGATAREATAAQVTAEGARTAGSLFGGRRLDGSDARAQEQSLRGVANINLLPFAVAWMILATLVIGLIAYRKWVAKDEDSTLHLTPSEGGAAARQAVVARKLDTIDRWGQTLTVAALLYGLAIGAGYVYQILLSA